MFDRDDVEVHGRNTAFMISSEAGMCVYMYSTYKQYSPLSGAFTSFIFTLLTWLVGVFGFIHIVSGAVGWFKQTHS